MKNIVLIFTMALIFTGVIRAQETNSLAGSYNKFGFDLFASAPVGKNILISPFSIASAMSIAGSGSAGTTAKQFQDVFHLTIPVNDLPWHYRDFSSHLPVNDKEINQFITANALWMQKEFPFTPTFQKNIRESFNAKVEYTDFMNSIELEKSRKKINQWVEKTTHEKIIELIPAGDVLSTTRLIIVNAVYFKGKWRNEFNPDHTYRGIFYNSGKEEVTTEFMTKHTRYLYFRDEQFSVIDIPYEGSTLSMMIILPHEKDGLLKGKNLLTFENYQNWKQSMMYEDVKLRLPKFKIEDEYELSDYLTDLGLGSAFTEDADFSGISAEVGLKIHKVIHKTFAEVNEEGTEAAGATAVLMVEKSSRSGGEFYEFKADHPFVFLIHDKNTGSILFMGRLEKL